MNKRTKKIVKGKPFEFGKNWERFLKILNEDRILEAEKSLKQMMGIDDLKGRSFLDIGSGSGLFSLAARRLGATVHSFDYDLLSVACTSELKKRYFADDTGWMIEQGDVLNEDYLKSLGRFDIVYSWGVLHHTGAMWQALENVEILIAEGGKLYLSIYNNQGAASLLWTSLKKFYNRSPTPLKWLIVLAVGAYWKTHSALSRMVRREHPLPFKHLTERKKTRGMSVWHDLVDWVGGYPFEVATPEEIFDFYREKGFELTKLKTCAGGIGCNEYVFFRGKG